MMMLILGFLHVELKRSLLIN